ncbi:MAG: class I SAM-dependent methyltransferase [Ignavibacteriae bacterium]|nr:class I SAM-dependent methyltransferase [Ignavibacteriota bacterium]
MKVIEPYSYFSLIYSHLMSSVDYKFWADYIKEIHETLGQKSDIAFELAAGNCSLANNLQSQFKQLYVSDISKQMLKIDKNSNLNKICCDMKMLPFNYKFNFIFSAFDSVNYISDKVQLNDFFGNVKTNLHEDGLLLFDISLRNNSIKHLKSLNRKGKYKNIQYVQKSIFDEEEQIHYNHVRLELENGKIIKETHKQKIYDFYTYFDVLENNSFYVLECFDAFTFDDATENSDRVQFIVKRKN